MPAACLLASRQKTSRAMGEERHENYRGRDAQRRLNRLGGSQNHEAKHAAGQRPHPLRPRKVGDVSSGRAQRAAQANLRMRSLTLHHQAHQVVPP